MDLPELTVTKRLEFSPTIADDQGQALAVVVAPHLTTEQRDELAKLIVDRCNAYPALEARLREAEAEIDAAVEGWT